MSTVSSTSRGDKSRSPDDESDLVDRRRLVGALGTLGLLALAGCAAPVASPAPGPEKTARTTQALGAGGVLLVATIAELRALPEPTDHTLVVVLGYYAVNDGGGGQFVWDPDYAGADEGGLIIEPSTAPLLGRWRRLVDSGSPMSVRWFGAHGDGLTDDDIAFQNALMASTGVGIYIPPGTYRLTGSLFPPPTGSIVGAGKASTILKFIDEVDGVIVADAAFGFEIADLTIHCLTQGASSSSTKAAIVFGGSSGDCLIRDIDISAWGGIAAGSSGAIGGLRLLRTNVYYRGFGIQLHSTVSSRLVYVDVRYVGDRSPTPYQYGIWIEGFTPPAGGGVYLDHVTSSSAPYNGILIEGITELWARHLSGDAAYQRGIWIKNCLRVYLSQCFANIAGMDVVPPYPLGSWGYDYVIENDAIGDSTGFVVLEACHAGRAVTDGLLVRRVTNVTVSNCTFDDNGRDAIWIDSCRNVSLVGNTLRGRTSGGTTSNWAIEVTSSEFVAISGNNLRWFWRGLHVHNSTDVTVTGNSMRGTNAGGSFSYGVFMESSHYSTITGNRLTGYQYGLGNTSASSYNVFSSNNLMYNGSAMALYGSTYTQSLNVG